MRSNISNGWRSWLLELGVWSARKPMGNPQPHKTTMQSHKLLLTSLFTAVALSASAQGTAFTYQGQLQNNGSPASGTYDLTFTLFNTNTSGVAIAGPVTNNAVGVT